jgi:cephalosporin hydroxylase
MTERFQRFSERQFGTSLSWNSQFVRNIQAAKWSANGKIGVTWRGIRMLKDPFSLSLYSSLLWELRPKTIIELGAFEGGSAIWFADVAAALGIDLTVLSFDKDPSLVKGTHPRVSFQHLDALAIQNELDPKIRAENPHPFLVIEDAHTNVFGVLNCLFDLLDIDDYLIVEDTCDAAKYKEFARFMECRMDSLYIDSHYTDNFGYNASWNWNSFLRRMDPPSTQPAVNAECKS